MGRVRAVLFIDYAIAVVVLAVGANLGHEAVDERVRVVAVTSTTMPIGVTITVCITQLVGA